MATLSEANYSLVLDFPPSEGSTNTNLTHPQTQSSFLLYQKRDFPKDQDDAQDVEESEQEIEVKESQNTIEEFEVHMYSSGFQLSMFVRSFFIYLFYLSGVGLLLLPLLLRCGPKFLRNHLGYSDRQALVRLGVGGIGYFLIFLSNSGKYIDTNFQSSYHFQTMLICSLACAAAESNLNKKLMEFLKKIDLSAESFEDSRFRIDTFFKVLKRKVKNTRILEQLKVQLQKEGATEEEIKKSQEEAEKSFEDEKRLTIEYAVQNTIQRLNIDISLFYLTFFEKTPQKLLRKVRGKDEFGLEERGNKIIQYSKMPKSQILTEITQFEYNLFYYKYFTKPNKYDNEKAHVYTLACDLLHRLDRSHYIFGPLQMGIISCLSNISAISNLVHNKDEDLEFFGSIWRICILVPSVIFPYFCLFYFISKAVDLMQSKFVYMEELEQMMYQASRLEGEKERPYPYLNLLDFMSLKSWVCLRKILMHVYNEKLRNTILAISLVLIIEVLTLAAVALYYFGILGSSNIDTSNHLFIFTLNALLYLTTFLFLIYYASNVNSKFEIHRNIIIANKQIVITLFKLYPDFVGANAIEPGTYIYNVGLNLLKKEFGEDLSAETKKKMKEKYKTLMETYDSILEELDYEEMNNPIKILGLPITKTVVRGFAAVLVSLSTPLLKQGWNYVYSLKKIH